MKCTIYRKHLHETKNMQFIHAKDSPESKKERKSFQILFSKLNTEHWAFNGRDHFDHGMDYGFEYIENNEYKGYRLLSQIKSSSILKIINGFIPIDIPVKTVAYAINSAQPFILFLVDLNTEETYYLALQDYFIANKSKMQAAMSNTCTVRVHIPIKNKVNIKDSALIKIAKSQYSFSTELIKTR